MTKGIEAALELTRAAAGDKNVGVWGGANVMRQFLKAGLLDEMRRSGMVKNLDRRAALVITPAVLLTTLTFAVVPVCLHTPVKRTLGREAHVRDGGRVNLQHGATLDR